MSVENFIPKVWGARLLANLDKNLVFGNIVNRDYEGEISQHGDTVNINQIGEISIGDYNKNTGHGDPEDLSSNQTTLSIDQAKYFAFNVHDADKVQANIELMNEAMGRASYGIANIIDEYIASLYSEVPVENTIGDETDPEVLTDAKDAYNYLIKLGVLLDEANVPEQDRWAVIPSWLAGAMKRDERILDSDPSIVANGYIGSIDSMDLYKSNNVPTTIGTNKMYKIIAGYKGAISFANQFTEVEAIRSGNKFADTVRGLNLYGARLVQPEGIAVLSCEKL